MQKVKINTEFITLGQFLKIVNIASSGGEAKYLVKELDILVNEEPENRRGKKLYVNTVIEVKGYGIYQIV